MTRTIGRQALLEAFDRLFDRAATKLNLDCSASDKAEAKRDFEERYDQALQMLDAAEFPPIAEPNLAKMEQAIDSLPPGQIASFLAAGPLATQVQEFMRSLAMRAAEQRLIEHLVQQADNTYGGN